MLLISSLCWLAMLPTDEKHACYSSSRDRFASLRGRWLESNKRHSYWNFSCPVEWSKYSCVHQGRESHALHAGHTTFEPSDCNLPDVVPNARVFGPTSRITLHGDCLTHTASLPETHSYSMPCPHMCRNTMRLSFHAIQQHEQQQQTNTHNTVEIVFRIALSVVRSRVSRAGIAYSPPRSSLRQFQAARGARNYVPQKIETRSRSPITQTGALNE